MKKYIVIGGEVQSNNDGDIHFIDALRLCELYGVTPSECYLCSEKDHSSLRGLPDGLPILRPNSEGIYKLVNISAGMEGR